MLRKTLLLLVALFIAGSARARNLVMYRPFEWEYIEVKTGERGYEFWYPKRMSHLKGPTQAILDEIWQVYSRDVFSGFQWTKYAADTVIKPIVTKKWLDLSNTWAEDTIRVDTTITYIDTTTQTFWRPKKVVICGYPSLQEFCQQRLIWTLIPAGVLGFTELGDLRAAIPFPASFTMYKNVAYHEVAHIWMFEFMQEATENYSKRVKRESSRAYQFDCPLWFIEGFAELLNREYNQDFNQSYLAVLREDLMRRQICDLDLGVPEFARMMGMDVYSFGYSFMSWVVDGHGIKKVVEFLAQRPRYRFFEDAWKKVFGKELSEMESQWHKWLARKYFKTIYADSVGPELEKVKNAPEPFGFATYDNGKIAFYAEDKKWEAKVLVKDLKTKEVWKIHHMFEDKSLWYRLDNPPVIKGDLVALVVNREGQDELRIYQLLKKPGFWQRNIGRKKDKKIVKVLRHPEILTIENPRFDGQKILFEGVDKNGFSDIYIWNMDENKIERLTKDIYRDFCPVVLPNSPFIACLSDRINEKRTGLVAFSWISGNLFGICQTDVSSYFDQLLVSPSGRRIALRTVSLEHSPQAWLLDRKDGKMYLVFSSFEGIRQILAFESEDTLLIIDREGKTKKLPLELTRPLPGEIKIGLIPKKTWQPEQPKKEAKPVKPHGWRYRYGVRLGENVGGFSTATGEEIFAFAGQLQAAYDSRRKKFYSAYDILLAKIDLRKRLEKQYIFHAYKYYWYRSIDEHMGMAVVGMNSVNLGLVYYWPFNFENGIGFGVSPGWMERGYPHPVHWQSYLREFRAVNPWLKDRAGDNRTETLDQGWTPPQEKYKRSSLTLGIGPYFHHDAVFGSYGEVRSGSWLFTHLNLIATPHGIWEGYFIVDGRYYFQLGSTRALLANRLYWVKSMGKDRNIVWSADIYREGYLIDIFTKPGTDLFQLQTEFRFPIFNWIACQPAFFPLGSEEGIGFRVNGSFFWYSGDIWFAGEGMRWTNRAGFAMKFMLGSGMNFRYEIYRYLKDGEWSDYKSGWHIGVDF